MNKHKSVNSDCNNVASIRKADQNTSPETMIGARYRRRRWEHVTGGEDRNRLPKTMIGGRHGSQRSNHEDVQKISLSVFVTNFLENYGAKDLWNTCKIYEKLVDAYIPNRISKAGKRFGFVRFIKVLDVDRLVNNLCTLWVGRYKLHANVAKFQRDPVNKHSTPHNDTGIYYPKEVVDSSPSLVLDDSCLNQKEYSLCLLGKVKDFASLSKLKVILDNEGFMNIELKYMGGFWVMMEFHDEGAKKKFQSNLAMRTWFSQIIQASYDFNIDKRMGYFTRWGDQEDGCFHRKRICICTKLKTNLFESFKVVYRGKLIWVRAKEVLGWVPDFVKDIEEESDSDDDSYEGEIKSDGLKFSAASDVKGDSDVEAVPELKFEEDPKKHTGDDASIGQNNVHSEDPFDIYVIINKKSDTNKKDANLEDSLKFPPGFTPRDDVGTAKENSHVQLEKTRKRVDQEVGASVEKQTISNNKGVNDVEESICSGHFSKSEVPRTGCSIIRLMDDLVNVGQTMGYDMAGYWVKELCVSNKVNFLSLQETKMEKIELFNIKRCWGNFAFEYVWDPNMFKKINDIVSDYFTMVRGMWVPNGKMLLIISVYAPQELSEKRMLWDYLSLVISNWEGEVVIMRDFNEVHDKRERFGSVFNRQGANSFNSFISSAGLVEVPLDGCSFTWCHKSATKMSKLDRFLVSDNLMCLCPNISSSTLDRYLSYHRPILMREVKYDYGPVPFRFFHYWFEIDDFDKLVEDTWKEAQIIESNVFLKMLKKLRYLKVKIQMWSRLNKESLNIRKRKLKAKLADLDLAIDKGVREVIDVNRRHEVVRLLQDVEKIESLEPVQNRTQLEMNFLNRINSDQKYDLEREIDKKEEGVIPKGKKKKQAMIFKVDFEKVYNSVRWDFLDDILKKFGFGEKWCNWIQGLFKGIVLSPSFNSSHLFYADDDIFMGQWSQTNIDTITYVLNCFHRASGLRINMIKSKLMGISVDISKVEQAATKIDCVTLETPFNYLGSKVGGLMSRWKNVMASKDKCGLGVSSLFALNRALMFKWVWRFISQSSSLWARVIKALHGEHGKIGKKVKSTYPSIWLNIIHEVELPKLQGIDLLSFIHSKFGNREDTSFWEVAWHGDSAFKDLFPRIGGAEHAQFDLLKEKVEGCVLVDIFDRWVWSLEGSGDFTVSLVRKLIDDVLLSEVSTKTRWIKAVPIKVNVHAWKVKIDFLPTRFNISRRGMDIESILCPICGNVVESSRHLFFTCRFSSELMRKISCWWNIDYMEISSYEEWLDWILKLRLSLKHKQILEEVMKFADDGVFGLDEEEEL
nr:RNA-directed DNA polymerase, eukaryota, reverse transcriptase zinc-binding domain protein [Tanacetum cinerariifolium]